MLLVLACISETWHAVSYVQYGRQNKICSSAVTVTLLGAVRSAAVGGRYLFRPSARGGLYKRSSLRAFHDVA